MTAEPKTKSILVVDDDRLLLRIAKELLDQLGVGSVHCADSAVGAFAWLDAQSVAPDLIISDLNMPDIDGIEFLRQLRARKFPGCVAISTGEDDRILQTALQLVRVQGMRSAGSLRKPWTRAGIGALLAEVDRLDLARPRAANRRVYSSDELRQALAERQLFNVYQPQVRPSDLAVIGIEALVRWAHPTDGTVFPDQFIGLAEESGLIDELTWTVVRCALEDLRAFRDMGIDLRVSVNVSMDNLRALSFPDQLLGIASECGTSLDGLVLEITESRLMNDPVATLDILARLRLKHVRLSIDDFGTGHSSLTQLRDVPFDELKIDRGFVQGAWRSETNRAIVEASLGMAQKLRVESVAEGVEDADDWDFVRSRGCGLIQGYFVARPMAASRIAPWIDEWRARGPELSAREIP